MAGDRPGEFQLIKRYFAPLAQDPGSLGLTDDACVFSPDPGTDLVLTKDVLAADVHFFGTDPAEAIAAKALRVNLSDLAAKGARARGYLLGLALPADWTTNWLERFCNGLAADQATYNVSLYGGDTIRSGNGLEISITAIGEVPSGRAVRRSGARPGDVLFVSGTIGDGAAGLKLRLNPRLAGRTGLSTDEGDHLLDRYLLPRPRTSLAPAVQDHASAALDVSDGLFQDARHLCQASNVGIEIDCELLPVSSAVERIRNRAPDLYASCVNGGDDYEILACVPVSQCDAFEASARNAGCPVTRIGHAVAEPGALKLVNAGPLATSAEGGGFKHF